MTYHMERISTLRPSGSGTSSEREGRVTFPHKLHEALTDDSGLLMWHKDGKSFLVNESRFERLVMKLHPGLVQIPTFANFRRQLRWYSFDWNCLNDIGDFEFSHPNFIRGRVDEIDGVLTRRKSFRVPKKIRTSGGTVKPADDKYCEDTDTPRGVPGSRMTLRTRVSQAVPVETKKRRYYKKRAAQFSSDDTEQTICCSPVHAEESPELWWYYCAIFGEPAQTLPVPEPMPGVGDIIRTEGTGKVFIPVYFHEDPTHVELYQSTERDVGLFGMKGHIQAESVEETVNIWDLNDVRTYHKL